VIYQGIRLTPEEIVSAAVEEGVDLVGLSVLSGSHLRAVADVLSGLKAAGADIPVVVGGIIPAEDARTLRSQGVARVFTPKDFELTRVINELVSVVREAHNLAN
jgi:(2R)-ethylmalonyl-CoA mutase